MFVYNVLAVNRNTAKDSQTLFLNVISLLEFKENKKRKMPIAYVYHNDLAMAVKYPGCTVCVDNWPQCPCTNRSFVLKVKCDAVAILRCYN